MMSKKRLGLSLFLLLLLLPFGSSCQKAPLSPEAKSLLSQLESSGDLLVAKRIKGDIPLDPASQLWNEAKEIKVLLVSQTSVIPRSPIVDKSELTVKALFNKKDLGLLLSWEDKTKSDMLDKAGLFQDAIAVEFPLRYGPGELLPYIGMGNKGRPVNVWQWNASWQEDLDQGFQGTEGNNPQMVPNNAPLHFRTGEMAGSPLSKVKRESPVANLLAEGFGTLASVPYQGLTGKGVWNSGRWTVVIKRRLKVSEQDGFSINGNMGMVPISFAIWDGANKERNGIKRITKWRFLHLEDENVPVAYLQSFVIGPFMGADIAHGKQLVTDLGCIQCHNLPGKAAVNDVGSDLVYAGAIHRPEYLLESIKDPNAVIVPAPGYYDPVTGTSTMPSYNEAIQEKDFKDMAEYLRSLQ